VAGPVVFLDKDGTLVVDVPYNVDPARIRLAPGAADGLPRLAAAGYRLAVVTNQSGVARGLFPEAALAGVERRLGELLADIGVPLAGFFYCPHHPAGTVPSYAVECECRKPAPGMVLAAARRLGADPRACWMVGDILHDVEAGRRAGCRTVLVDNGNETEWVPGPDRVPHHRVPDLAAAADVILTEGAR
jgi:histidinol-phosphate phosphatase family protein